MQHENENEVTMPAKVFISCGQASENEKRFASDLKRWLESEGFEAFVAIDLQSIQDVNNVIIANLRTSDYYIFVDFRRERIFGRHYFKDLFTSRFRGSLFTHQELSISYLLGFPEAIFLQEQNVQREGLLAFILGNARTFRNIDDALKLAREEVKNKKWHPAFSRAMELRWIPLVGPFYYADHSTRPPGRFSHIGKIGVKNKRIDLPAINTVARLEEIIDPQGQSHSPDTSSLKWAGEPGYSKLIFQGEEGVFDAFGILDSNPLEVYLHSASDFSPRQKITQGGKGTYILRYSVSAVGFPKCEAIIELNLTGQIATTTIKLISSGHYGAYRHATISPSLPATPPSVMVKSGSLP